MTDMTIVTGTDGTEYRIPVAAIDAIAEEYRAQLANAAASEVDAVQGRQECEAALREARERIEALEAQRRLLARAVAVFATAEGVDAYEMGQGKALKLAHSILEEDAE